MNEASVTLNAIEEARARLKGLVHETPLDMSHTITTLADRETYLKLENLQRTGSFKIRGASNCIMTLSPEQKERGIIAASAGNHAQGVALGGTMNAIRSTVVMPEAAPLAKVQATKGYGANVVLHGKTSTNPWPRPWKSKRKPALISFIPMMIPWSLPVKGR